MEAVSVAIAVQSGEMVSRLIDTIESHPLLDFCGAARSLPDLLRLLHRFHPKVLLISTSMMDDLEKTSQPGAARALSAPLSFLLSCPDASWGEKELARVLRQPLRYCGLINRDGLNGEDLFHQIRQKVELYRNDDLSQVIERHKDNENRRSTGFIVLTSSKGGAGATLISCTLASVLSSAGRRVLLMDMDSDLSQLLHLKPKNEGKTILELYPMAEEISWDLVRISIHRHKAGFYLLPHGLKPEDKAGTENITPEPFLRNLLFLFDVVVMDFPRPLSKGFMSLLHHSPTLLLLSLPDTLSANCARRAAVTLRRCGLDLNRLHLVINRYGSSHALRPHELARAVGAELLACLPEDERSGMDFAELGEVPPPDSPLGKATAEMAVSLGHEIALAPKPGGLHRLIKLRKQAGCDLLPGEKQ